MTERLHSVHSKVDPRDVLLAERLVERLGRRQIACAESCTAGRVAAVLASVASAADSFRGGLVAYQPAVKRKLLGVTTRGVLSLETAEQMARGACELLDANVAVATTGVAGGQPQEGVEPGTVFIATRVDGRCRSSEHRFDGLPEEVCARATHQALVDLCAALDGDEG